MKTNVAVQQGTQGADVVDAMWGELEGAVEMLLDSRLVRAERRRNALRGEVLAATMKLVASGWTWLQIRNQFLHSDDYGSYVANRMVNTWVGAMAIISRETLAQVSNLNNR